MRYAYAYDKGGKLSRYFGVDGIPHAVLVDSTGTVVWSGHPGNLDEGKLGQAVVGALPKPLWEWPSEAKAVKAALLKHAYKSALDAAAGLSAAAGGEEIRSAIQGMVKAMVAAMNDARQKGDFLTARTMASALEKELAGLSEAAEATRVTADLAADKSAQEVIKGQQKLAKIEAKAPRKKKDVAAAIEDLKKLKMEYPGTYVETAADALIQKLGAATRAE